jgi:ribonucleoside-diphosphate reductase alpha chain
MAMTAVVPEFSDNAVQILERRYLRRDADGKVIETPAEMLWRVAQTIAAAEDTQVSRDYWAKQFYGAMASLTFLPNSPTLMNAGTETGGTYSACFVLPVEDTLDGILDSAKAAGMVQKFGGGTGFGFSDLRAKDSPIRSTHGSACGPVSVLLHYDDVARLVTQGGKRLGANMGVLRYDHPDIMEFVTFKGNTSRCVACEGRGDEHEGKDHNFIEDTTAANFNVSVAVDNKFFDLVKTNGRIPFVDHHGEYTGEGVDAALLFKTITEHAHANGDPGMLFMQRINEWRSNPVPSLGPIKATNPCGEKPLYDWDSCNLGHLNLTKFYLDVEAEDWKYAFDWDAFKEAVYLQVRFVDNTITVNNWPTPENEEISLKLRRIGAGIMGFADLLYMLRIPYSSEQALEVAKEISAQFETNAWLASVKLAEERGAFPAWEDSIYNRPTVGMPYPETWRGAQVRNSVRTTIAPTGTTSILAGVSSGIEPNFQLSFTRQHRIAEGNTEWVQMQETNPVLEAFWEETGITTPEAFQPPDWAEVAADISVHQHIAMQAIWQSHIDDGVSKTVNLPEDATVSDVAYAYKQAYDTGCLGITVYRDNSRSVQVLGAKPTPIRTETFDPATSATISVEHNVSTIKEAIEVAEAAIEAESNKVIGARRRLPKDRTAKIHKFRVGEQEGFITVGLYEDGSPGEIFIKISKQGSTVQGFADTVGVLISLLLQYGATVDILAEKLVNVIFEPMGMTDNEDIRNVTSIVDYVARYLKMNHSQVPTTAIAGGSIEASSTVQPVTTSSDVFAAASVSHGGICPDCGSLTYRASGCVECPSCGWSMC